MEIIGYIAAILIGLALGIIGGGGSILTVPVLVYLFQIETVTATAYSLFIVGITSIIGAITYLKNGLVHIKTAIIFGLPSILVVYFTRAKLLPAIPTVILSFVNFTLTKSTLLLLLFAIMMIATAIGMIKNRAKQLSDSATTPVFNYPIILAEGSIVGLLTGLVGAGGGFLIIPTLVLFNKLPIKKAIGTSLVIIAAKSLIGFLGENSRVLLDYWFLFKITSFAVLGILISYSFAKKIDSEKLKPIFGWFILVIGVLIIIEKII